MAITDLDSARAWLETKPLEVQVAFAARCALRALPGLAWSEPQLNSALALQKLRAALICAVLTVDRTPRVTRAAAATNAAVANALSEARATGVVSNVSSTAADAAAGHAGNATAHAIFTGISSGEPVEHAAQASHASANSPHQAAYAAQAPTLAKAAYEATYAAASSDAIEFSNSENVDKVFRNSLWPAHTGQWRWQEFAAPLRQFLNADPDCWDFWSQWYEGILAGQPLSWDLVKRISLLPDSDWNKGPEHISGLIRDIEANYLSSLYSEGIELTHDGRASHLFRKRCHKIDWLEICWTQ